MLLVSFAQAKLTVDIFFLAACLSFYNVFSVNRFFCIVSFYTLTFDNNAFTVKSHTKNMFDPDLVFIKICCCGDDCRNA